ncbi:hypothetical protein [Flavobacterium terrigena]|uniref:YD repeat-containing protein n=1 Tax=Flavobacterium terrigena TaxID=402734 RepID=A0A1H6QX00_9FLAO|nr:hypothetical protein [Flavobacterium terrigena]SEI43795.1 hypothetical protein SAMN05660918_0571 [Flavobacterium terrigena]
MKTIYLILILLLYSCKPIVFKELQMDHTQDLIGKIKEIKTKNFYYTDNNKDTIINRWSSIMYFDKKNNIIKQIDKYSKFTAETSNYYKDNLLEKTILKNGNSSTKIEYKYDKKKNLIEYNQIENDTLYFSKTIIYDSKCNPIEKKFFFPNHNPDYQRSNSIEKLTNNYKDRTVTIKGFDENQNLIDYSSKRYYNKNGFIIKIESIRKDSKSKISTKSEFDKSGNLLNLTKFDTNGNVKEIVHYKNIYDKIGNIITREKYIKEKLIEKTTYDITYW